LQQFFSPFGKFRIQWLEDGCAYLIFEKTEELKKATEKILAASKELKITSYSDHEKQAQEMELEKLQNEEGEVPTTTSSAEEPPKEQSTSTLKRKLVAYEELDDSILQDTQKKQKVEFPEQCTII